MLNKYRFDVGQFNIGLFSFKITGTDARDFLQNQSTYDTNSIAPGEFHLVSFTDIHGKVEAYGWLLNDSSAYFFLVPEMLKDVASERLQRYLISEDVSIDEPTWEDWTIVIGTRAWEYKTSKTFSGEMFSDRALLAFRENFSEIEVIEEEDRRTWQLLTGTPDFSGKDFTAELIANSNLFDLSVSLKKGCYPGQETISKIVNNRGAAKAPVLIRVDKPYASGELLAFDKRIGEVTTAVPWDGAWYLCAKLLRDFRVNGLKISATLNGEELNGVVTYYPLLTSSLRAKAEELFYEATEFFKKDNLQAAEECFHLSLKQDPSFTDSLESLGVLLGRQERFEEAISYMRRLADADPDSVLAHTNLSLYLMKLGRIEEAEEEKSKATIKSFKKFGEEAKDKQAEEVQRKSRESEWVKREQMFKEVLEIDPEDTLANYGLGNIALERGEWERALSYLDKVLTQDPKYSVAYLALGKALKNLKRFEEARAVFTEGIKVAASKGDLMPANQMQAELDGMP